jgi:hypothetical protein
MECNTRERRNKQAKKIGNEQRTLEGKRKASNEEII